MHKKHNISVSASLVVVLSVSILTSKGPCFRSVKEFLQQLVSSI